MDTTAATCLYCRRGHANLPHHLATAQACTPQAPTLSRYTSCSAQHEADIPLPLSNLNISYTVAVHILERRQSLVKRMKGER